MSFVNSVKLPKIGDKQPPLKVDRISNIKDICEGARALDSLDKATETEGTCDLDALCLLNVTYILTFLYKFKSFLFT